MQDEEAKTYTARTKVWLYSTPKCPPFNGIVNTLISELNAGVGLRVRNTEG